MEPEIIKYIESVDEPRREVYKKILNLIEESIPEGFELTMQNGMPSFVVPLSRFPQGYHCTPNTPLPFISLGVQKNHIGLYHMGIYSNPKLLQWFEEEYAKVVSTKLDMGKSCIRFKNINKIPYQLISDLTKKVSVDEWVATYLNNI